MFVVCKTSFVIAGSSNGRTLPFGGSYEGPNPSPADMGGKAVAILWAGLVKSSDFVQETQI